MCIRDSIDTADFNIASNEKNIDRDDLDMYLTHQIPECEEHEFGNDIEETVEDEFYIPTTDAGDQPFQIEKNDDMQQTRGVNISGHVMLNFVGTVLTRERHLLKPSSIHKYFLQRIVATSIGKSVSLLYPEGVLFPSIFWRMQAGSIVGAIPATLLTENTGRYGFASLSQHTRSRFCLLYTSPSPRDS